MRSSLPLLVIAAWTVAPIAWSQKAAPEAAATRPAATDRTAARPTSARRAAPPVGEPAAANADGHSPSRLSRSRRAAGDSPGGARAAHSGGVLALGATDITGNKELPKVMVIVPWRDSPGAGEVIKPTDSLMDEVLGPVDRGVFQRQIRYYSQLQSAAHRPAAVAPTGDSR